MKKLLKVAILVMVASYFLAGCITVSPVAGATGMVYTQTKGPIAYGQNGADQKTGQACQKGILFFATGDASIQAAEKAGGITNVKSIDGTYFSVLGIYGKFCTVVKGS